MRALSPEGVLSVNPTGILALQGSGPKEAVDVLKKASIPYIVVPEKFDHAGILDRIRVVGKAHRRRRQGRRAGCEVDAKLKAAEALTANVKERKRILFILSFKDGRILASGSGTAADGIIALAGGVNAVDGFAGYKQLADEAVIGARPDVILMMDRGRRPCIRTRPSCSPIRRSAPTPAGAGAPADPHGRRLSARLRPAHRRRRARPRRRALRRRDQRLSWLAWHMTPTGLFGMMRRHAADGDRSARAMLAIVVLGIRACRGRAVQPRVRRVRCLGRSLRPGTCCSPSADAALSARDRIIIYDIRLPRVVLGVLIGAALAVSGAVMQGLFRNPLADPGPDRHLGRIEPRRGRRHRARRHRAGAADRAARQLRAAARGLLRRAGGDADALPHLDAARPHLGRHHAARRHRARRHGHGLHRHPDLRRRRPAIARPDLLVARLARRRDLAEDRHGRAGHRCWRCRPRRSWRAG